MWLAETAKARRTQCQGKARKPRAARHEVAGLRCLEDQYGGWRPHYPCRSCCGLRIVCLDLTREPDLLKRKRPQESSPAGRQQPTFYEVDSARRTSSELQLDVSEGDAQRRNRHPRQRSKPSTPHHADTSATSVSKIVHADCPCSVLASATAVDTAAPCGKAERSDGDILSCAMCGHENRCTAK